MLERRRNSECAEIFLIAQMHKRRRKKRGIHFKRCLLFENQPVTKQFVVSRKVDKFKLCVRIRLLVHHVYSILWAIIQLCLCAMYTYECVFVLVFVCFYNDHTRSVCITYRISLEWMCGGLDLFHCNGDAWYLPHHTHNTWLRQHYRYISQGKQSTH